MDCGNTMCSSTRKGLSSIEKEFTCAICHELFVKAHTLSCSHSYCERCITSWVKKNQECPTCRKPIEGKPIHSIALDNAVEKLVEMRVEAFAERSKKNEAEVNTVTKQSECGTQTTVVEQSRDCNIQKNYKEGGARIRHFFHSHNGGPCHEFHFFGGPHHNYYYSESDYSDDDDDDDYDDDDYNDDYNGLPGCYWGGHGRCFNCGKLC